MPTLSIIIPALNEADGIAATLSRLQSLRQRGTEVIMVDGGSSDATVMKAEGLCDAVLRSPAGRAIQMNAGAAEAKGDVLLFLHADSLLPERADELILFGMLQQRRLWGRFDITIAGQHPMLKVIGWFMNHRSRLTGIATGDQGLFVASALFESAGGFANIRLMEDIALCKALKRRAGPPLCLRERVTTSGRRWEKHGVARTILLMWWLRLRYFFGASPDSLHAAYYGSSR